MSLFSSLKPVSINSDSGKVIYSAVVFVHVLILLKEQHKFIDEEYEVEK